MPHKPLKLIRASAGSGKTFSLTAHYLVLLFSNASKYRQILAVTFTNKATAEMKSRILGALSELADTHIKNPRFLDILVEQYPSVGEPGIRLRAQDIYRDILHDYSRFAVSTIDGFVQQVIRSFAFELNLDNGYKLELNEQRVKDELARGLNVRMESDPALLEWVATLAIDRINEGKDWNYGRALDGIAGEIFKERYFPFQEAMRTMGEGKNEEFARLREVLLRETAAFLEEVSLKASQAFGMLAASGVLPDELAGKTRNPLLKLQKVADGELSVLEKIIPLADDFSSWPNKALKDTSAVTALYAAMNPVLVQLKDIYTEGIARYNSYAAIHKNAPYLRLMQEMADLVSEYRTENRALLISDAQYLLKGITGQAEDNPSFIWEKTGNRFRHFLFDEFQDTSGFQWDNFLPLVKNALATYEEGAYPEHLVVGDVKQSIYRWRNGDWRILHQKAATDLGVQQVTEHTLEYNRRSSETVIAFNNFLYRVLPRVLQDHINAEFGSSEAGERLLHRYGNIIPESYAGSFQLPGAQTLAGGEIDVELIPRDFDSGQSNPALVKMAEKILYLLGDAGFRMSDIGVLVKRNSEGEDVIRYLQTRQAELSEAAGKMFQLISGEALRIANDKAVQLIVATIRMLVSREQEQGIFKALCARLYSEIRHTGRATVDLSPADWLSCGRSPLRAMESLLPPEICREYRDYLHLPLASLMEKLVEVYRLGDAERSAHLPYLLAFRDQVAAFTAAGDEGAAAFLEWWDSEGARKSLPSPEGQDAVTVMTVHKSKGLEFRAVIVPFCNWEFNQHSGAIKRILWVDAEKAGFGSFGTLPVDYSTTLRDTVFAESYFEEFLLNYMDTLNTLYVATTRAKEYLSLTLPQKGVNSHNLFTVFSAIFAPGNEFGTEYLLEEDRFRVGRVVSSDRPPAIAEERKVRLDTYPAHDHAGLSFAAPADQDRVWYNEEQRKGSMIHEILAASSDASSAAFLLDRYIEEGSLMEAERAEVSAAIQALLHHPEIAAWTAAADRVLSEKTILSPGGAAERPDKVFVMGDKAVLLDFKFGAARPGHQQQVKNYQSLLREMGAYREVRGYLWYAQTGTLLEVE